MIEWIESLKFLGVKLINIADFAELFFRFLLESAMLFVVVYFPYLRYSTRRNYAFSYIAVGCTIFFLCFLLSSIKLELGFALGLFAIFGIIRYRTDAIPFKQMTYLFVVIGLSVINALTTKKVSYAELIFANVVIVAGLWMLERYLNRKHEGSMVIEYENINHINTQKFDELINDLKTRTGFNINHFEIEKIDYLKDTATITIYFDTSDNTYYSTDNDER